MRRMVYKRLLQISSTLNSPYLIEKGERQGDNSSCRLGRANKTDSSLTLREKGQEEGGLVFNKKNGLQNILWWCHLSESNQLTGFGRKTT
jgi:hypothetical protein